MICLATPSMVEMDSPTSFRAFSFQKGFGLVGTMEAHQLL